MRTVIQQEGPFCLSMRRPPRCFCIVTWIWSTLIPFARLLLQKTQNKSTLDNSCLFFNNSRMMHCFKIHFTINMPLYCLKHWYGMSSVDSKIRISKERNPTKNVVDLAKKYFTNLIYLSQLTLSLSTGTARNRTACPCLPWNRNLVLPHEERRNSSVAMSYYKKSDRHRSNPWYYIWTTKPPLRKLCPKPLVSARSISTSNTSF